MSIHMLSDIGTLDQSNGNLSPDLDYTGKQIRVACVERRLIHKEHALIDHPDGAV